MKIAVIVPSLANKGPIIVAKEITEYLVKKGISVEIYYFDDIRELNFSCPCHRISFFKRIDLNKYDIVHSHTLRPDLYVFLQKHKRSFRSVSTMHCYIEQDLGHLYNNLIGHLLSKMWPFFLKRHDKIVCLTKHMRSYYEKYFNPKKLETIYNGRTINQAEVAIVENDLIQKIKDRYTLIGAVGSLIKRKGIDQIINALQHDKKFAVVIIGSGPEADTLKSLAIKNELKDRCFFLGYKKNVHAYYKYFDIYAMTSHSEGFPLALLEAGYAGVPTICSDLDIFREIYPKEVVYFNPGNIDSLVEGINTLFTYRPRYAQLIYEKTNSEYSVHKMGDEYYQLFSILKK